MRSEVQLATPSIGYVRVQLGGGQVGVAEHLLHGAEVGAAFEEVRGERVAQQVRVDACRVEARRGGEPLRRQTTASLRTAALPSEVARLWSSGRTLLTVLGWSRASSSSERRAEPRQAGLSSSSPRRSSSSFARQRN